MTSKPQADTIADRHIQKTRLELLADKAGVDPKWLRRYLRYEIERRRG